MKATLLAAVLLSAACGSRTHHSTPGSASSVSYAYSSSGDGYRESVRYESGEGYTRIFLDEVRIELRDPARYHVDLERIGLGHESDGDQVVVDRPVGESLLRVDGREVSVEEGQMRWGDEVIGPAAAGDVYVVDDKGLWRQSEGAE